MNYNFSLNNGSDSRVYNHTGDIIHTFTHVGRGTLIRTDAAYDHKQRHRFDVRLNI